MSLRRRILKSKRLEAAIAATFAAYLRFAFATTRWRYDGVHALTADLISEDSPQPTRLLSRTFVVDPNNEVMQGLAKLFGRRAIVVEGE